MRAQDRLLVLSCQIKAPEWLQMVWCKGGVNQMASTRKTVAALEVFENPCTPAVA